MKNLLLFGFLATLLLSCETSPKSVVGVYSGSFEHGNFSIDLQFNINEDSTASFTSLEQNAFNIPLREVLISNDSVSFYIQSDRYRYEFINSISKDRKSLAGILKVDNKEFPYQLERQPESNKIQPREVGFQSQGKMLYGNLWTPAKPNGKGLFMVTSSGGADRNGTNGLAQYFSSRGYTFFHFDKSGTGKSEGEWQRVLIETLAEDDIAGINAFSEESGLSLSQISIMGSSQGGSKVPYILSKLPELNTGIAISVPGSTLLESDLNFFMNRIKGQISEADFDAARNVQRAVYNRLAGNIDDAEVSKIIEANRNKSFFNNLWIPEFGAEVNAEINYTPVPYFEKVSNAMLLINGTSDIIIPSNSMEVNQTTIEASGNSSCRFVTLDNADHAMNYVEEGSDFPYFRRLHPNFLKTVTRWLEEH